MIDGVSEEKAMLDLAARCALRARGRVEPNPMVGCVIVKDGRVIGMGHHRRYGGAHAEREALASCRRQGHDPRGATMYVTLEPCNAHGKQPPCVEAVLEAGIARVVFARRDESLKKGGGAENLAQHGVVVLWSNESPLATSLGAAWQKRLTRGLPWVIAKWAQTIDGFVATRTGESKWISNERSRARVHDLRGRVDAILTGVGTVVTDDPLLTARGRHPGPRSPVRVVADTDLDTPLNSKVVTTAREHPTLIACAQEMLWTDLTLPKREALEKAGVRLLGVPNGPMGRGIDLEALLRRLWLDHGLATVMTEAGSGLLGSLFEHDLVDEALVYVAPMLLGDERARFVAGGRIVEALTSARRFRLSRAKRLDDDIELLYQAVGR